MRRKATYDQGQVTDGWISIDPADAGTIERVYKKDIREGEEKLMLAVLQDAVECFQMYVLAETQREKRLFQEAEDWILETDSEWFFSFENICETLQLHPDYIRQGLLCWKEAKRKISSLQDKSADRSQLQVRVPSGSSVKISKTA
jgi:hypothetical protein